MALPMQTSDAWITARNRYVEDLNEEEQRMYFGSSPESLLDGARTAEKSHGTNSTTRKVVDKLQPFIAAIEQYGEAIDIYSSTYSLALGPIWGSIKVLLHIAREFGKYFDKIVEMFVRIGDVLPRFRTYERLFSNHERLIEALSMAYLDIITFCTNAKAVFRRGQRSSKTTMKVTLKLLWKPFDQQFGQQLSDFRQHQKNVEKEAGLAHMVESADARAMVLADQKQLEKRRREDNRIRILAMLHAVNYGAKHRKLQNLRHAGTGDWIFRQATYIGWKTSGSTAFLCCRGKPGCGKSLLASNLVDHLTGLASAPAASTSAVVYYYCDYADQRTLDLDRILGSLLEQLLLKCQMPAHIETQLLQTYAGGTRSPSESALSSILCSIVTLHSEIYIVLDGLDECEKPVWQALLKILKDLGAIAQCVVKIFVTCVEEGSVSHHLAHYACLQVSPTATTEDIKAFVTTSVRSKVEHGELRIRNPKLEHDIVAELISKANGMFLWVFFQLQDLCESSSDAMIRETLRSLPEGLGGTYKRILTKISDNHSRVKLARKVFEWATVAKRPLHVEELKEAVAIDANDKAWDEDKFPHEDLMLESCRGLIIKDEDDGTVHFAHHTVRQYLTGGLTTKVDPLFEVAVESANILAGQTCVTYLLFSDFESQITSRAPMARLEQRGVLESGGPLWIPSILGIRKPMFDIPYRLLRGDPAVRPSESDLWKHLRPQPQPIYSPSTDLKDKYRLLCYAIEHWEPHLRWYQYLDTVFRRRLESLAKYKTLAFEFLPWGLNKHFGPYGCVGCPSPSAEGLLAEDLPHISMIHYAAAVGNLALLTCHQSTKIKLEDYIHHERYNQETLLIACRNNRLSIVKYLIKQVKAGYDISGGKAVNVAASAGYVEVLQCLLSVGQYSVKQKSHVPLHLAAENGHEAVVQALSEAGAEISAYDEETRRSIIESAAKNGHDSVIRTLNRRGAFRFLAPTETNALHLAAGNGHVAATRALIEICVPTDMTNASWQSALHLAADSGHSSVVELLLEYDSNPFLIANDDTPVHLAAKGGHANVLEAFYKSPLHVDIHRVNNLGQTLLHSAAAGNHENGIRWLLENGAHMNANDSTGEPPLCTATRLGNETAVHVLLELGATVADTFRAHEDYNILIYAVKNGNLSVLRMLLENIEREQYCLLSAKFFNPALNQARVGGNVRAAALLKEKFDQHLGIV